MDMFKKNNRSKFSVTSPYQKTQQKLWIAVALLVLVLIALVGYMCFVMLQPAEPAPTEPTTESTNPALTKPQETIPENLVMLDHLTEWFEKNSYLAGWLRIDGTVIDYPVIQTPEDPDMYLRKDFEGNFSMDGTLFIEGECSLLPESDNTIIYGHNMRRGTMFHDLLNYKEQEFWEEHPIIDYSTLYEERQYEVVAAFYDRVYYNYENNFKFYQFIDYEFEAEFNEAVEHYAKKALYDTGVVPEFGDRFLTLVTCSYHERYGRFVVVAREIREEEVPGETAPAESVPQDTVPADTASAS